MVFGQHYLALAWGWTGVNVFFVLSGFLITGILFDTRDDAHRARNFYVRRTLRIFPLYYGLFAVLLLLWPVMHWRWSAWWFLWPLYLGNFLRFLSPAALVPHTALQMAADGWLGSAHFSRSELYLGHLWSLCVEEQFYLIWPWVVFWIRDRRKLLTICIAAVVLGPLLRLGMQTYAPGWMLAGELLYRFTPAQLDALLLGGLIALAWRGAHRSAVLMVARGVAAVGTMLLAAYLIFIVHGVRIVPGHYPQGIFLWGLLVVNLYSSALMVCALQPQGLVYTLLNRKGLRWVGRLSYGAYIFHDLPHGLYVHVVDKLHGAGPWSLPLGRDLSVAALALLCTFVLAWLSFRFFESPFLDLKDRWTVRS